MRRVAIPLIVGLAALGVYRATLAPGVTWAHAGTDGGDLITAAAVWGVPHPTGYPTYTALGRLFAFLPFGSIAFNLNLMSAACAALAAALVAAGVLRSLPPPGGSTPGYPAAWSAAIAGLTLAFGPMLWSQATLAEVHALNALFVAAVCAIGVPWAARSRALSVHERGALGLTWGLGLGNSITLMALAPIAAPALWSGPNRRWLGPAALWIGLCVYALIPLRAAAQPPINWGDARTLPNLVWLVSASMYRGYALAAPPGLIGQRLVSLARLWFEQVGWIGMLWVAWGLAAPRSFRRIAPALASAALYVAFALTYDTADSDLYLIPVWVLSAGYLGVGLAAAIRAQAARLRRAAVGGLSALGVCALLIGGWPAHDLSGERTASAWAEHVLSSAPAGAILVTHADAHTFALWYYRLAEDWRTDVSIVDARLAGYGWYDAMLAAQGAAPVMPGDRREGGLAAGLAAGNPARPVCDVRPQPPAESLPILLCDG